MLFQAKFWVDLLYGKKYLIHNESDEQFLLNSPNKIDKIGCRSSESNPTKNVK